MALTEYLATPDIKRYYFTQYASTISAFKTSVVADLGSVLPSGFEVVTTAAAPNVAIMVISPSIVLYVNSGDWVGYNYGNWQVVSNAKMSGLQFTPASV